jgi:hypothetical protein
MSVRVASPAKCMAFHAAPVVVMVAASVIEVSATDSKLQSPPLQFPVQVQRPVVELHEPFPVAELQSFILAHIFAATEQLSLSPAFGVWQVSAWLVMKS